MAYTVKIDDDLDYYEANTDLDVKVKYDAADPAAGYVVDKFVAGEGITLSEGVGDDENKLKISTTWLLDPVEEHWDITEGFPPTPEDGDRYISDGTDEDLGWYDGYIYEWDEEDGEWYETLPIEGMMVWLIFEMVWWVFMSGGWREVGWESYWSLEEDQMGITGDKSGSFDITTTGAVTIQNLNLTADTNQIVLDSDGTYTTTITDSATTSSKVITLPNATGTVALTSDILAETDPIVKAINGIVKSNGTTIGAVVSGTDIKTINSTSLLGSGDIAISAADEKVKYAADDAATGYLGAKVVAGTGISLAEGTGGDVDKLKITNTGVITETDPLSLHLSGDNTTGLAINIGTSGTLGAGAITGTSFVIGANALDTNEWAYLDGQDQAVKTTSSPTFAAKVVITGTAPSIAVGSGAGSGGSVSFAGTDSAGEITLITGTTAVANDDLFTMTFGNAFNVGSAVIFSPSTQTAAGLSGATSVYVTSTTTTFTLNSGTTKLADSTTYKWKYLVLGY